MKKKTRIFDSDRMGLIIIGVAASILYSGFEFVMKTYDTQTVLIVITILLYSTVTQLLMNKVKKSQMAIQESEKKYRLLAENATDIIWTIDKNFNFTYFSPSIQTLSGYSVDDIMTLSLDKILTPESYEKTIQLLTENSVQKAGSNNRYALIFEYEQVFKNNLTAWMEARATFLYDENKQLTSIQCVSRDITWRKAAEESLRKMNETLEFKVAERTLELQNSNMQLNEEILTRRTAEENLRKSENKYRAIFENTGTATIIVDKNTTITLANSEFEKITGYSKKEIEGQKSWLEFIETSNMERILKSVIVPKNPSDNILKNYECNFIDKLGKKKNILISFDHIQGTEESVVAISDISKLKDAEKQIYHQAFHDALTNLPNRILFMNHLNMAIKRQRRISHYYFAVIYLDIDRFKNVNDSLGHMTGDNLLVTFSQRIRECLRETDIMARFGGDEFVILLDDIENPDSAIGIAKRIQQALDQPFIMDTKELFVTASFGIVLNTKEYTLSEDIVRDADTAMYHAKEKGKARFEIFDKTLHEKARQLLALETDLRKAVEKDEFELYYQPIVQVITGELVGFEALIRWNHPQYGLINPDAFIPIAEETGLIIPIGKWVLEKACMQLCDWQKRMDKNTLTMSINVSSRQFAHAGLVSDIQKILDETGVPPEQLKLEITESVIMENTSLAIEALHRLKKIGLEIVIDDFGTGYSSLSYLQQLPIDTLKVDKSFVLPMRKDIVGNRQIVESIIALAHRLGIKVIAEGVETSDQRTILSDMKCQLAQGYLFAKPMNKQHVDELIQSISLVSQMENELMRGEA